MSWIAVAIVGGAALGAGATIYASSQAAGASQAATQAATDAQRQALGTEWAIFQQNREDYAPWREVGKYGLGKLIPMIEAGPGKFVPEEQPGYKFGFKNFIEKPYLSAQSAKGKRLSGETVKGLTKYASDYAETAYNNFLNRYYQTLTPFQSLAGLGMTATSGTVNAGTQAGQQIAAGQTQIGNIQAQNALNLGNIYSGAGLGIAGMGQSGIQNYMNYLTLKKLGVVGNTSSTPSYWGGYSSNDPWWSSTPYGQEF